MSCSIIKSALAAIAILAFSFSFFSCKKNDTKKLSTPPTCDSCDCKANIDALMLLPAETDSATVVTKLIGQWNLECISFTSKYGYNSITKYDSLAVQFTDSTYTFFKNDSLLFSHLYFVDSNGVIYSNGGSFFYGTLSASQPRFKDSTLGINTIYPYTGSYYLTFKRQK